MVNNFFSDYFETRLKAGTPQYQARISLGSKVVEDIINFIHTNEVGTFEEKEKRVDEILQVVISMKELVEKYFTAKEAKTEHWLIDRAICEIGEKLFSNDVCEALTCNVPLIRTLSKLYVDLTREYEELSKEGEKDVI